jgi:tRNA A-37 threonylcarbamoyl transferase component Bud32/membrane-associated phospholipid phosphatase
MGRDVTDTVSSTPVPRPREDISATRRITRTRARRRPSGEPPPLPHHLDTTGMWWLAALLLLPVLWLLLHFDATRVQLDGFDSVAHWFADHRSSGLTDAAKSLNQVIGPWAFGTLMYTTLLLCLVGRRYRHLLVYLTALIIVDSVQSSMQAVLHRPRPLGVSTIGPWLDYAHPSRVAAATCLGYVGLLYTAFPQGRLRQAGKWVAAVAVLLLIGVRVYLNVDGVTDLAAGIVVGVAVPLLAFRLLCPNEVFPVVYRRGRAAHLDVSGARGLAIRSALESQLGVIVESVQPFALSGSAGSTPLRVLVKGDPDTYLFAKLYAATHLRADRWYKLGRTLMYGRLEAEARFMTVRQLVQYEDYALRLIKAAGIRCPDSYGIVEITPEREYLLVTGFVDGGREISESEVDDDIIDQGLGMVRQLWDAGLAHRDIKPSNLLVQHGQLVLIDPAFSEVRPTPWRQGVDLANMMLVLALFSDARRVYERATRRFTLEEITEAFAATRGLTMPSQLRHMMRQRGRDLHAEFCGLLPPFRPIRIQRWTIRRVMLSASTVAILGVVIIGGAATWLSLGEVR